MANGENVSVPVAELALSAGRMADQARALRAAVMINNVLSVTGGGFDGHMMVRVAKIIDKEFRELRNRAEVIERQVNDISAEAEMERDALRGELDNLRAEDIGL